MLLRSVRVCLTVRKLLRDDIHPVPISNTIYMISIFHLSVVSENSSLAAAEPRLFSLTHGLEMCFKCLRAMKKKKKRLALPASLNVLYSGMLGRADIG